MRRHAISRYTLWTDRGTGSYRTLAHAMSAARWVARESQHAVEVTSDGTGQVWHVAPPVSASGG
jgi:hypothetical protein